MSLESLVDRAIESQPRQRFTVDSKLSEDQLVRHRFLVRCGELLHQFGTPSHRLERVVGEIAIALQIQTTVLYTPTALIVSIGEGDRERTYMRRIGSQGIDVGKLIEFDEVLEDLRFDRINIPGAMQRMQEIADRKPLYSKYVLVIASAVACCCVAVFFGGSAREVLLAGVVGGLIASLEAVQSKLGWETGLINPVAGFAAAILPLLYAHWIGPIDDRLVTLAALIILLPGMSLTIALTELAVGHLSAGVARLAGATATLLILVLGVAIAWKVIGVYRVLPLVPDALPHWSIWIAITIAPITFSLLFGARPAQWPTIIAISIAGFSTMLFFSNQFGGEVGSFFGALVVGCGSNLYARLRNRPAMAPLTPGLLVLVPGSVGYRSLTAFLERQSIQGIDFAFDMLLVAASLVGGLLLSSVIIPPKRIL
jgi:uncharacterized membrane protein YjjP (DUF1212 family)